MIAPTYDPYLTASAVDRYLACQGSAHLARVTSTSAAAEEGTARHEEVLREGGLPERCERWFGPRPRFEEAYVVDGDEEGAPRFLGSYVQRSYECAGPGWVGGSVDACSRTSTTISVADLKTGRAQVSGSLGDPLRSGQLRACAYLLLRYGQSVRPDWQPKRVRLAWFLDTAEMTIDDGETTVAEIRAWGDALLARTRRARQSLVPTLSPGPHCETCPSFDACPAQGMALRRVVDEAERPLERGDLIPAHSVLRLAKKAVERVGQALTVALARHGDVTEGGHTLRLQANRTTRVDLATGYAALVAHLEGELGMTTDAAAAAAAACVRQTITQESVKAALGDGAPAAIAAIAKAGGLVPQTSSPFPQLVKARAPRAATVAQEDP